MPELLVVSPEWVLKHSDKGVRIVDTRRLIDYRQKHVPNAVSIPFTSFVKMYGLAFYLPDRKEFEESLSSRGVSRDTLVIAYDNYSGKHASRLLYTLELYGHEKLGILDRPWGVYEKEGWPLSSEEPQPKRTDYRCDLRNNSVVTKETIVGKLTQPDFYLVDVRAYEDMMLGFIPGARNLPWYLLTSDNRVFRPVDQVRPLVDQLRMPRDAEVITYCEEGTSSILALYVLRQLGYQRVSNYLASYGEWGADPSLPKQKPVAQST